MKIVLALGLAGAVAAGGANAQIPTSPAAAQSQLAAMLGGGSFYDGWAMHLPSPRTTEFKPGVGFRSEGDCDSAVSDATGTVRYNWRQAVRIRSSSALRPVDGPMGDRIPLAFLEVSFGPSASTLRLFFRSDADRDKAVAAARFLGQHCNAAGFSSQE